MLTQRRFPPTFQSVARGRTSTSVHAVRYAVWRFDGLPQLGGVCHGRHLRKQRVLGGRRQSVTALSLLLCMTPDALVEPLKRAEFSADRTTNRAEPGGL